MKSSSRGFLLKRDISFSTKLQSSKKLWSTYCTPTAHELALSSLNSSSPVCSMMHGGGEYSYTTYYKPGIGSRFFCFSHNGDVDFFLALGPPPKKTTVTTAAIIKQKSYYKERCKSLRTFGILQDPCSIA